MKAKAVHAMYKTFNPTTGEESKNWKVEATLTDDSDVRATVLNGDEGAEGLDSPDDCVNRLTFSEHTDYGWFAFQIRRAKSRF